MATKLAKAYVQIIPTTKDISSAIATELDGPAASAGKSAGGKWATAFKVGAAGLAVGVAAVVKGAIGEGSQLEQSIGGIETLFKDSADTVRGYAAQAYKTAGLSANQYMSQVTSFSASLLQSLGGDTAEAADVANMAIVDMADNANKMGTDMASIQNAYQGFAKQNYTMLDNLKLGYGGTKKEMERLLAYAETLPEAMGRTFDISNLNEVYEAIHLVQGELGITGTTVQEAERTIQGAFASMKAAASNFLGALALGEDLSGPLTELVDSTATFLIDNLAPMVGRVLAALPDVVMSLITDVIPGLFDKIESWLQEVAANSIDLGEAAGEWIAKFIEGLAKLLEDHGAELIELGLEIAAGIAVGLVKAAPDLVKALGEAFGALIKAGLELVEDFVELGAQIVGGIIKGIQEKIGGLFGATKEMLRGVIESSKGFLGIESPSRVFADEVGAMMGLGIAQGIESTEDAVAQSINGLGGSALVDAQALVNGTAQLTTGPVDTFNTQEPTIDAILQMGAQLLAAIQSLNLSVELDGASMAKGLSPYTKQLASDQGASFSVA